MTSIQYYTTAISIAETTAKGALNASSAGTMPIGGIIGAVMGVFVVLLALALLVMYCLQRRKKEHIHSAQDDNEKQGNPLKSQINVAEIYTISVLQI